MAETPAPAARIRPEQRPIRETPKVHALPWLAYTTTRRGETIINGHIQRHKGAE